MSSRVEIKLLTFDVLCARRLLNVAKPRVKFARVARASSAGILETYAEYRPTLRYLRPRCCSLHMKEKKGGKERKRKGLNIGKRRGKGREKRQKREKDNVRARWQGWFLCSCGCG